MTAKVLTITLLGLPSSGVGVVGKAQPQYVVAGEAPVPHRHGCVGVTVKVVEWEAQIGPVSDVSGDRDNGELSAIRRRWRSGQPHCNFG